MKIFGSLDWKRKKRATLKSESSACMIYINVGIIETIFIFTKVGLRREQSNTSITINETYLGRNRTINSVHIVGHKSQYFVR